MKGVDEDGDGQVSLQEWRNYIGALYTTRAERKTLFNIVIVSRLLILVDLLKRCAHAVQSQ